MLFAGIISEPSTYGAAVLAVIHHRLVRSVSFDNRYVVHIRQVDRLALSSVDSVASWLVA